MVWMPVDVANEILMDHWAPVEGNSYAEIDRAAYDNIPRPIINKVEEHPDQSKARTKSIISNPRTPQVDDLKADSETEKDEDFCRCQSCLVTTSILDFDTLEETSDINIGEDPYFGLQDLE